MVFSVIVMIFAAVLVTVLAFNNRRYRHQAQSVAEALNQANHALRHSHLSEHQLRLENNELQQQLQVAAADPLTCVLGWQVFIDRMQQQLVESERHHFSLAVLCVEIDNYALLGDTLGQQVGENLLQDIALRLNECVRKLDSISRLAENKFVVLLTQIKQPETVAIVSQRILQSLARSFPVGQSELFITANIGISVYPADTQSADELLRHADYALQLAKRQGMQSSQFYQERMQEQGRRELALYNGLSNEAVLAELDLCLAPIFNRLTNKCVGLDVSVNWVNGEFGRIDQAEIMRYMARQRKLDSLVDWMLSRACQGYMATEKANTSARFLVLPISVKQLEKSAFIYYLSQALQTLKFNPRCLLLEVVDGFEGTSFDIMERSFGMLHYLGIKVAVTYLGSQSIPLQYFKHEAIHYLKLDQSLLVDIAEEGQQAIVQSLVQLATSLNMQVIAQGVATTEQADILQAFGCTLMEGSLWGDTVTFAETIDS